MQDVNKPIAYMPLAIIGFALHFSILIYGAILFYLGNTNPGWMLGWRVLPNFSMMLWILAAMALFCATLALAAPMIFKSKAPSTTIQPDSGSLFLNFSPPTVRVQQLTIIRMAIAEAAALFGLVLGFLNQSVLLAAPFMALGLIVQFIVGPIGGKIFGGSAQS